jgi:5S rRNA maturation endonuclease (ribonuclease M5)
MSEDNIEFLSQIQKKQILLFDSDEAGVKLQQITLDF